MIARASSQTFAARVEDYRRRVACRIESALQSDREIPPALVEAIEYSVLGPGKRVRPLLTYATGELLHVAPAPLDAIAAAVELVHAYSLVHDDLPAMDDDDLRRGRPTTHRAFDEATAILAGDGLQALAFEILCCDESLAASPTTQIRVITWLARAAGPAGMVGGQMLDLAAEGKALDEHALEDMHRRKTGALFVAAARLGAIAAGAPRDTVEAFGAYGAALGLAFQVADDILDETGATTRLGKDAGRDRALDKATVPALLGLEGARRRAADAARDATEALARAGVRDAALEALARFAVERDR